MRLEDDTPRCVEAVTSVVLKVKTGDFENGGFDAARTDYNRDLYGADWIRFDLCPEEAISGRRCLRCKFTDSGVLSLNRGDVETIDFSNTTDRGIACDHDALQISELVYPDDVQFFQFSAEDVSNTPGYEINDSFFDGWLLAGVELQINGRPVYRNPCVNRWIDGGGGLNQKSKHSLEQDQALCYMVTTANAPDADTDETIRVQVPLRRGAGPLNDTAVQFIRENRTPSLPYIHSYHDEMIDIRLNWGNYDDFRRYLTTFYGVTLYQAGNKLANRYRIKIFGGDGWKLHKIQAYHFTPGSKAFVENQTCHHETIFPGGSAIERGVWLSTQSSDGDMTATRRYPATGWRSLPRQTDCDRMIAIQIR